MNYQDYVLSLREWLLINLPDLMIGFLIIAMSWLVGRWINRLVIRKNRNAQRDEVVWDYLGAVLRYTVLIVGCLTALKQMNFPVEAILATFGISGLIIGLGARQSIANYFSGLMMLAARPFKIGDLIEFGPPPQIGRVSQVRMTYTRLTSLDNDQITVPNMVMWRNKIINFTSLRKQAMRIPIAVPYDVDVDWIEDLALDVLSRQEEVLDDPPPSCAVTNLSESSKTILLTAWTDIYHMDGFEDVVSRLRTAFSSADLPVTVPASDVLLRHEE